MRRQSGSDRIAMTMPTNRPRKHRPRCQSEKPYTSKKTSWKAPKNRYKMPSRMAENMHRFRHIGSRARRRIGRYMERRTVCGTDRSNFSIGAFHRSSLVSCRSFCALRRRRLPKVSIRRAKMRNVKRGHVHWMIGFWHQEYQ